METESRQSLNRDHRQLANDLSEIEWRVSQRLFPGARARFFQLKRALEQHLAAEERCLPSPTSEMNDYCEAVVAKLRPTNAALRRLTRQAADAIDASDTQSFSSAASDLHDVLAAHARQVQAVASTLGALGVEIAKPKN